MNGRTAALFVALFSILILVIASLKTGFNLLDPASFQLDTKLIYIIVSSLALGSLLMFLLATIFGSYKQRNRINTYRDKRPSRLRQLETALQLGELESAQEILEDDFPQEDALYAQKLQGDLEVQKRNFDQAESLYRKNLDQSKGWERAATLFALANLWTIQGKSDQTAELYREILNIIPNATEPLIRLRNQAVRDQNWKEALLLQENIEKEVPKILSDPSESSFQIGIRYELARSEFENGSLKTAQALLKYINRMSNSFVPAYLLSGEIQEKLGNQMAALRAWEQGLKTTQHPVLLRRVGEYFLSQNAPELAIRFFKNYALQQPDDPVREFCLGDLYLKLEMTEEATRLFEKVKALHPEWLLNQIVLGDLYHRAHKPEQAIRQFRMSRDVSDTQSILPWQCYECNTTYPEYRSFCLECLEWDSIHLNRNQAGIDYGYEKSTASHL